MRVQEALATGTRLLTEAGIEGAARDARRLMAAFLEVEPGRVTLHLQDEFDPLREENFIAAILERKARRPMSHLLGYRDFYGRRFEVSSDVLDPRGDTETLIEAALAAPFCRVLDLGTGSGCILLTLLAERAGATGLGTDIAPAALRVAERNAEALMLRDRARLIEANWFDGVTGDFDLIVSNPPYIAAGEMAGLAPELSYEPRGALTDEGDGLSAYRAITAEARDYLRPGGRLILEIGASQGEVVRAMVRAAGFAEVAIRQDIDGHDRVVEGRNPG
ncbi:peptide chain release factor N(5)-glutamine methyltransferase [Roseovarius faecimaris]|uniref:Release factor glutamine methyltransferase n=1 Tax=Roseovarius faecimaris TaxID=2494550 RepID=A0A6I6IPM9_9RHOB|nr:peptide chain release factor N(5)-glutamine methyltransferase [Roseovarius faecimaris]QGX98242.1 peptide chain release factor N(5)-glutamine methyltransferase [Roseovarius faecimaris]